MTRPKVKICGITNLIDAKLALSHGADYIGFNNIESSPRFVSIDDIREIVREFSDEEKARCVLLTDGNSIDAIMDHCFNLGLSIVQPYGKVSLTDLRSMKMRDYEIFKPFPIEKEDDLDGIKSYEDLASLIILDSNNKEDWNLFKKAKSLTNINLSMAGDLSHENIAEAIFSVEPYMVELTAALESKTRTMSLDKLKSFFQLLDSKSAVN